MWKGSVNLRVPCGYLMAVAACALVGCSDPGPRSASGSWHIDEFTLNGSYLGYAVVCGVSGIDAQLSQSGTTVSGTMTTGTLSCLIGSTPAGATFDARPITGGSITGSSVRFTMGQYQMSGTYSGGNDIAGSVTGDIAPYGEVSGVFHMTR